tara:strand:- start:40490 stop:41107 length:618 start_codon:yes stop_codon:yes gene_type:complete
MKNIKDLKKTILLIQKKSKVDKLINKNINFENINIKNFKFNIENNLEYHSVYKKYGYTKNTDARIIFNGLLSDFIQKLSDLDNLDIDKNKITLYRAIGLNNINSLNPNLGIYWSFDENNTSIFDDEDYDHSGKKENYKKFEFKADIKLNDIDWYTTFNLFFIQDFNESEIRLNKDAKFENVMYKEKKESDFKKINLQERKRNPSI